MSGEVSLAGFTLFAVVGGTLVEFKVSPSSDESVLSKEFHPTATTALGSTVSEAAKFAVIEIFESIESVKGFSELSLPVQPVNSYPVSGVAVIVTEPPVVVNDEPELSTEPPDDDPTVNNDLPVIGKIEMPKLSKRTAE